MVAVYTWTLLEDLIARFTYAGVFVAGLGVCLDGVLAGDSALYWVGHHWGDHILEWRITRLVLTRERGEIMSALTVVTE